MKNSRYSCPQCGSNNTKRCAAVYKQAVGMSVGPRYGTFRFSLMAERVSPPTPPPERRAMVKQALTFGSTGVIGLVAAVLFFISDGVGVLALPLICLALYLIVEVIKATELPSRKQWQRQMLEYEAQLLLYERLWTCQDCERIFKPEEADCRRRTPFASLSDDQ